MQVALRGSSASTVIVAILLLTHARRLGERISVSIVGEARDAASVRGPALVYNAVLSGCGVGKVAKSNALVCVGGQSTRPLVVSLVEGGITDWFELDRSGAGLHPSSKAVVRLCRHPEAEGKNLGRVLRGALTALGCPAEPALLDLLFGAPLDPLERLALALRAGRTMTGSTGDSFNHFIQSGVEDLPDPLPTPLDAEAFSLAMDSGHIQRLLGRIQPGVRDSVEDWLHGLQQLDDRESFDGLLRSVAEVGSFLVSLPMAGMLPSPGAGAASIANHLGRAIGAVDDQDCAMRSLIETFEFLGGNFIPHSPFAVEVPGEPPPEGRMKRWEWLCQSASLAREESERLWERLVDPIQ